MIRIRRTKASGSWVLSFKARVQGKKKQNLSHKGTHDEVEQVFPIHLEVGGGEPKQIALDADGTVPRRVPKS